MTPSREPLIKEVRVGKPAVRVILTTASGAMADELEGKSGKEGSKRLIGGDCGEFSALLGPLAHAPAGLCRERRAMKRLARAKRLVQRRGVLGQSAVTDLPMLEEILEDMKGVLHPRSHLRLEPFDLLRHLPGQATRPP